MKAAKCGRPTRLEPLFDGGGLLGCHRPPSATSIAFKSLKTCGLESAKVALLQNLSFERNSTLESGTGSGLTICLVSLQMVLPCCSCTSTDQVVALRKSCITVYARIQRLSGDIDSDKFAQNGRLTGCSFPDYRYFEIIGQECYACSAL